MNGTKDKLSGERVAPVATATALAAIGAAQRRIAAERGWCEGQDLVQWDALADAHRALEQRDLKIKDLEAKLSVAATRENAAALLRDAQTILINIQTGARIALREPEIRRDWVQLLADWPYLTAWYRRCNDALAPAAVTGQMPDVARKDPLGCLSCTHEACARYWTESLGGRHECRAMADNACARPDFHLSA
ncbi:hypothetical protein [Paraburkholderia sediminicola]|uniref:hypothetical protein n=1 Tax=Paraburkholderia sediminicola TaxID=458836 RepID=UPI0038B7190E